MPNLPAGTNGTQFSISLDFTSDGVTKGLTFGPLTVGSISNGLVITSGVGPAPPPVSLKTDSLLVDQADYDKGIFAATFLGPPRVQKTLYAEKQGLQIYHSWMYNGFET
jgi:hypothetical protein